MGLRAIGSDSDLLGASSVWWKPLAQKPNYADKKVNGTCDLIDFFPVWVDLNQVLAVYPVLCKYSCGRQQAAT